MSLFSLENIVFRYGAHTVFNGISGSLENGFFYGLIGPNGSGKSTFIDILLGIAKVNSGQVLYQDIPISSIPKRQLAKTLSLVPQSVSIGFDFNVYDVVLMGRHPHISRFSSPNTDDLQLVEWALEQLDICHLRNRAVTQLSGGERQRVAVARALAQDTPVMVLDEATSSLDIRHTLEILRVLKNKVERNGSTIIAAIHDLNLAAAFCDKLIVLKDKQIYRSGTTSDILCEEMVEEVFGVKANVVSTPSHQKIEYKMW